MFICPTCSKEFEAEAQVVKHYLSCWKEQHPSHQSKSAPRSPDIETRTDTSDLQEFMKGLQQRCKK